MKYLLPNGEITYSRDYAKLEFAKHFFELEENTIEFSQKLGMKREFINVDEMVAYIARKLNLDINDVKVKKHIDSTDPYNPESVYYTIDIFGYNVGEIKLY